MDSLQWVMLHRRGWMLSPAVCTVFTFFLLDLLLWSESDELSSLVSMNSRLLKLSLPPPRSLSLSPPADFLFFSSFLPPDFLLSLTGERWGEKRCIYLRPVASRKLKRVCCRPYFLETEVDPPLSLYSFFALSYCLLASPAFASHSWRKQKPESVKTNKTSCTLK